MKKIAVYISLCLLLLSGCGITDKSSEAEESGVESQAGEAGNQGGEVENTIGETGNQEGEVESRTGEKESQTGESGVESKAESGMDEALPNEEDNQINDITTGDPDLIGIWWYEGSNGDQPAMVFTSTGSVCQIMNLTYNDTEIEIRNNKCYLDGSEYDYINYIEDITNVEDINIFKVYDAELNNGLQVKLLYYDGALLRISGDTADDSLKYKRDNESLILYSYLDGKLVSEDKFSIEDFSYDTFKLVPEYGAETILYRVIGLDSLINYLENEG